VSTAAYGARARIVEALREDLVGPRAEDEVLDDTPFSTYVAGVLYPVSAGTLAPENEVDESDEDDEASFADPPVNLANTRYPSSIGVTFAVDTAQTGSVEVAVEAARYVPESTNDGQQWRRTGLRFTHTVDVHDVQDGEEVALERGLNLYTRVRRPDADDAAAVTVALVNRREAAVGQRDVHSYYQASLAAAAGGRPVFVERRYDGIPVDDVDLETYRLIYRDVRSFAVGHGTSVQWTNAPEDPAHATEIRTTAVPSYELPLADSNPQIPTGTLTMLGLARDPRERVCAELRALADRYQDWIAGRQTDAARLAPSLHATAAAHLADCTATLARIRSGVDRLESDNDVLVAFRLANLAMLRQRERTAWIDAGRPEQGPVEDDDSHRWRPFQIAFILLNLDGIADPRHPDRETLDLLWFPTGGGKTEAYLGLIATTVLLRRLRLRDKGRGVTVLMRYTLRLLTIQQFERASALICALEALRRERDDLGDEPISIGLWVGKAGTPATVRDARTALNRLETTEVTVGNPMQVRACPWCGQKLDRKAYWITRTDPRLVIRCLNRECEFSDGLPIHVVDEDIYRVQPTLIIATADKFATLPWVQGAHRLFAVDEPLPPPELIVQDELHLISGPLGTLAGLYEAAVDILCTHDDVRAKIIASTATIRRAAAQTRALFDREMRQFPPPGLDAGDSFFAVTADPDRKPTRLYVGAMAPGTSWSTLMIRAYAALMQAARDVEVDDAARDPYWTLVGYFNSLRVLGGARIQVLDDVRERLAVITGDGPVRELGANIELTSREPSSAIPAYLQALDVAYPDPDALDYVLATNMISVGVDIDRLGLMVVMGQPQATAEYIQATSRVGRQHPGLVVTLYNAGRSRDRSHYESFPTYHSALYRQVESTSVTPFSPRARDRALHAVLLTLARTGIPELRANVAARDVEGHLQLIRDFNARVADRAKRVEPGSCALVRDELEQILTQRWLARAEEAPALVYANPRDEVNSLLTSADKAEGDGLPTPSSLRDVDSESNLYLVSL
jgi:hypothetical protein